MFSATPARTRSPARTRRGAGAFLAAAPFKVDAATIAGATSSGFALPPAEQAASPGALDATQSPTALAALRGRGADGDRREAGRRPAPPAIHIAKRRAKRGSRVREEIVYGTAPNGSRLVAHVLRTGRTALTRRATATVGAYRLSFRVRRGGRFTAHVSARGRRHPPQGHDEGRRHRLAPGG